MRHDRKPDVLTKLVAPLFSKLRKLSILQLDWFLWNNEKLSSITNLTLFVCNLDNFYYLLEYVPMLKYLHIHNIEDFHDRNTKTSFNSRCNLHLKQLIINNFSSTFEDFEMYVKQTPNLRSLTISALDTKDMIDAYRWEQLITSCLSKLTRFKFEFTTSYSPHKQNENIIVKFRQFQTNFWEEQHHWFTEYMIQINFVSIYTIPYFSNFYILSTNYESYCKNLRDNVNTFINVTNLMLDQKSLSINCEYYFSNVTSLILNLSNSELLTTEHIEYLKKIINLFNLKHLNISDYIRIPINSSVLLEIVKQASQLSSLTIHWNQFASFINDSELCKYLNKRIKTLHIDDNGNGSIDDSFKAEQFCEVFSNIEHLQCKNGFGKQLSFLLNRLPKLSTLKLEWLTRDNPKEYLARFENEIQKLNVVYDIITKCYNTNYYSDHDNYYDLPDPMNASHYIDIRIWFGNNMP
jgi:hypothetical protein